MAVRVYNRARGQLAELPEDTLCIEVPRNADPALPAAVVHCNGFCYPRLHYRTLRGKTRQVFAPARTLGQVESGRPVLISPFGPAWSLWEVCLPRPRSLPVLRGPAGHQRRRGRPQC